MTASNQAFIRAFSRDPSAAYLPPAETRELSYGEPPAPHFSEGAGPHLALGPTFSISTMDTTDLRTDGSDSHGISTIEIHHAFSSTGTASPHRREVQVGSGSSKPRPHVQFPSTIRLDVADRRHTRLTDENESGQELERRPLSDFSTSAANTRFRPALEVDRFRWPKICRQIAGDSEACLDALVAQMVLGAEQGRSVITVVGDRPGVGCTTAALCLTERLAARGVHVALVDASFADPALAERLGLAASSGWEDVIRGELPLADAVIASIADQVALLPIRSPMDAQEVVYHVGSVPAFVGIDVLRENFDITLLDAGSPVAAADDLSLIVRLAARVGTAGIVSVRSAEGPLPEMASNIEDQLATAGIPTIGMIQNFKARSSR